MRDWGYSCDLASEFGDDHESNMWHFRWMMQGAARET